ncbi:hypothetical protein ACFE04_015895 [Oxalis oulophora]
MEWAKALSAQDVTTGSPEKKRINDVDEDDEEEEEEEEDVDFNPFLKGTPSPEASSSLSSEIEETELDVIDDNVENNDVCNNTATSLELNEAEGYIVRDSDHGEEDVVMQCLNKEGECENIDIESAGGDKENESIVDGNNHVMHTDEDDEDDEDLICRRTRARYSLASFSLEELETFLQDDDDYLQNADEEQEYKKFLAAFLQGKDGDELATEEQNENEDDDDEDFEIELEELLDSDNEEATTSKIHEELAKSGRRPQTRQNRHDKTPSLSKRKLLEQPKKPLRPLIPILPNGLVPPPFLNSAEINHSFPAPAPQDGLNIGFTPNQIGQLHSLIHEHVQLLIQIYSLSILDPARNQIASQTQGLLVEMLGKCNQTKAYRTEPHPSVCFQPPYTCSSVPINSPPNIQVHALEGQMDSIRSVNGSSWVPFVDGPLFSVLDVAPLSMVGRYMDDVQSGKTRMTI